MSRGGSMQVWMELFPNANFYGIDYNVGIICEVVREHPKLKLVECSQADPKVSNVFPGVQFDLVIDDASHVVSDQISTFNMLRHRLSDNSKYIIEDIYPENQYPDDFMQNFEVFDLVKIKNRGDDKLFVYNHN